MYKKILVAVDGSPSATRAAEHAVKLAKLMESEIVLIHCHKPFPEILGEPYLQEVINRIREKADKVITPYRQLFEEKGISYTERILEGPARERIVEVARIENCDLIVMGSRGLTHLQGLVVGSVANRVLHHTSCPVLIVR